MSSAFTQEIRLKKMIAIESMSAQIYAVLAEKDRVNSDLWGRLRIQEMEHARIISKLQESVKESKIVVESEDVTLHTIDRTCEFFELQLRLLGTKQFISSVEALSLAETIEDKTIDALVFDAFVSKCPEFTELLKRLKEESITHRDSIRKRKNSFRSIVMRFLSFCQNPFN
jgi:rubrerythrin